MSAVWDSSKETSVPCDIYVDDQGTDGHGTGERWPGVANATDATETLKPANRHFWPHDEILVGEKHFTIGANVNNHANNKYDGTSRLPCGAERVYLLCEALLR